WHRRAACHRYRRRSRRSENADRTVPARAQTGWIFRAALHRARRAALLDERSDRKARQPVRISGAATDTVFGGEAVSAGLLRRWSPRKQGPSGSYDPALWRAADGRSSAAVTQGVRAPVV